MSHRAFRHYLTCEQVIRITLPANPETARHGLAGRTTWVQVGRRHARVLIDPGRIQRIQLYAAGIQREPETGRYYHDIPLPRLSPPWPSRVRPWRAGRLAAALQPNPDAEITIRHPVDATLRTVADLAWHGLITVDIGPPHQPVPGSLTAGDLHGLAHRAHPRSRVLCRQFGDAGMVLRPVIGLGVESPSLRSLIPGAPIAPGVLDRLIGLLQTH